MMNLRGHEFDFDISCPEDLERYLRCSEEMTQKAASAPPMPADMTYPHGLRAYTDWMAAYVRLLTDWIDGIFGDGACNKLLGPKTSLSNVMSLCDEIGEAAVQQGNAVGLQIKKYMPNRATRRKADGKK